MTIFNFSRVAQRTADTRHLAPMARATGVRQGSETGACLPHRSSGSDFPTLPVRLGEELGGFVRVGNLTLLGIP